MFKCHQLYLSGLVVVWLHSGWIILDCSQNVTLIVEEKELFKPKTHTQQNHVGLDNFFFYSK